MRRHCYLVLAMFIRRIKDVSTLVILVICCCYLVLMHRQQNKFLHTSKENDVHPSEVTMHQNSKEYFEKKSVFTSSQTRYSFSYTDLVGLYSKAVGLLNNRTNPRGTSYFLHSLLNQTGLDRDHAKKMLHATKSSAKNYTQLLPTCDTKESLLLILVISGQKYYNRREAIRLTWGSKKNAINRFLFHKPSEQGLTWQTIFAVGQPKDYDLEMILFLENKLHQDMLVLNYNDDYSNLTNKTMTSFQWLASAGFCKAKYILKTDDDCYVNHVQLLPWLQGLHPKYKYIGKLQSRMVIVRDPTSRYFVPTSALKGRFYPPYCSGGGYVLKYDILQPVVKQSLSLQRIRNEDAYMGLLFQKINAVALGDNRFLPFIYDRSLHVQTLSPCKAKNAFVIHHVMEKGQLIYHWRTIVTKHFDFLCDSWSLITHI